MKTYFVEMNDPNMEFDKKSNIIALTPQVCYEFDKLKMKYSIIEDYYDYKELLRDEYKYFKSQFKWIADIDKFLLEKIPELRGFNLKLGSVYFYYFKTMIDPIVLRCYALRNLITKLKPSEIIYISEKVGDSPLDLTLFHIGKSLYSQITPLFCDTYNIPFKQHYMDSNIVSNEKSNNQKIENKKSLELNRILSKFFITEELNFFLRHGKECFPRTKNIKLNILLLKLGYNGLEIVKTALKRGHNVFLLSDSKIKKYSVFGPRHFKDIKIDDIAKIGFNKKNNWKDAVDSIDSLQIIDWANNECQVDVSNIIIPRIRYFILDICPQLNYYFNFFMDFLKKERIDFVVTPFQWSPIEFAAINAANYLKNAISVGIQHGSEIFLNRFWYTKEMLYYDVFIGTTTEMQKHFKKICATNNYHSDIYSSSHRFLAQLHIKKLRDLEIDRKEQGRIMRNHIVYLPTVFMWDAFRIDGAEYPDTWYYKFQKALIDYFSTKRGYTFVWKGLPSADSVYNPIPDYIKDNKFSNIEIAINPFTEHLRTAERVICDFPCTGFYESLISGVPTMSLYKDSLLLRKSAVKYFDSVIRKFRNFSDAIEHIESFLNNDPDLYKLDIEMNNRSVIEILEDITFRYQKE